MPATSKRQWRFFKAIEHNPKLAKEKGMKPSTAREYTKENKGKTSYKNLPEKK